jgi:arabinogalactan endo-1,4-beta-galactosidase
MKHFFYFMCLMLLHIACSKSSSTATTGNSNNSNNTSSSIIYKGADLSFTPEIEQYGATFSDSGTTKSTLTIFKNNGCNLIRVRLWYNPSTTHSSLAEVLSFCKRINDNGLKILLDFHYSDSWADPGQQTTPAAWNTLNASTLQDSVFQYTKRVITFLQNQNTMPAIVQIGNEINTGILWNLGKLSSWTDPNLPNLAVLLNKAIAAVKSVDVNNQISIMLHYAGPSTASGFFDLMQQQNISYDIIGLSYYPWWHGQDLTAIGTSLNNLATRFNKKIMIVETAYPWTLNWNDYTNNIVGQANQLITGYDATPQGQLNYLLKLKSIIENIPNNLGIGFCYWAPDWVAFKGTTATNGSTFENLTLFDFQNKTLPAMQAFK